jgi:FkbM family methyltransferase
MSRSSSPTFVQRLLRAAACLPIPKLRGVYSRLPAVRDDRAREFTVDFFGLQYKGTLSQYVDRQIFYFGAYSPLELSFLRQAAEILRLSRSHITLVDVGANVGQHSLFMSRHADRVLAFEPNDEVADRLAANIAVNRIENIDLVRCALGSEVTEARLGSGLDNNSGSRSLVWSLDAEKDLIVPVACGDVVLAEHGIDRVDLLKIDVEGYEKNVFAGMRKTLERDRPVILFELVGAELKAGFRSEDELREALYCGAELFSLGGGSSPRLLPFDWFAEESVCLPEELLGSFSALLG